MSQLYAGMNDYESNAFSWKFFYKEIESGKRIGFCKLIEFPNSMYIMANHFSGKRRGLGMMSERFFLEVLRFAIFRGKESIETFIFSNNRAVMVGAKKLARDLKIPLTDLINPLYDGSKINLFSWKF